MNSGWDFFRGVVLTLVPLAIIAGWAFDRWQHWKELQPADELIAKERKTLEELQHNVQQHESFDGFHSADDVVQAIVKTDSNRMFWYQTQAFPGVTDAVFQEASLRMMELLGSRDARIRDRAWQMLEVARSDSRFKVIRPAYVERLTAMLREPSVPIITTDTLAWLVREKIEDPAIRDALTYKMNNDHDPGAPFAAYTLAKLYPEVDIGPRLIEMVERKHEGWRFIEFELPKYLTEEDLRRWQEQHGGEEGGDRT